MARRLAGGARLVLASHNPGKLAELTDLLRPLAVAVISAGALGLPEPPEDAPDFVGNARHQGAGGGAGERPAGAGRRFRLLRRRAERRPRRVFGALGGCREGFFRSDGAGACTRWMRATDSRAWFVAALCLAWPDSHTETFVGRVDGTATWPPRGDKGFGYDPMFLPDGSGKTFGELDPAEKHAVSHRARAFAQFMAACLGNGGR